MSGALRRKEGRWITAGYGRPLGGGIPWQLRQDDFLVPVVRDDVQCDQEGLQIESTAWLLDRDMPYSYWNLTFAVKC